MTMQILDSPSDDPRFNMAAEEYLMKETAGDYAFFYVNSPSVIIGKHQNAWAEINPAWMRRNGIPVIRRISGGGAVWHDRGNLNFSFILTGEEGKLVNFRQYASPVLEFLQELGIPAEFGKRNEMLVGGLKISGNAEHVHRKRVLHHGTLLFSSDLDMLRQALDAPSCRYRDRAVQSVPGSTANIRDFLEYPVDISEFRDRLLRHMLKEFGGSRLHTLNRADRARIAELVREKYSLWEWNIGYSPKYTFENAFEVGDLSLTVALEVERGIIRTCRLDAADPGKPGSDGILQGAPDTINLARDLAGKPHDPEGLRTVISSAGLVKPEWIDNFVEGLF